MGQIAKRVEDKRLLKLIRAFLNAGVMENGLVSPSTRQPRTQRRARTGDAVPAGPSERRRPSLGAAPSSPRWSAATSPLNVSGPETISVRAVAVRGTPRFWVGMISRAPRDEGGPG